MVIRSIKRNLYQEVIAELKVALAYIKSNLESAAELRTSFIMQVLGMMINNTSLVAIWVLFFAAFGKINGWGQTEVIGLQGFIAFAYGITYSMFSGASELPMAINNGVFDSVLLTPRNLYLRILTLVTRTSALGDTIYGVILLGIYAVLAKATLLQLGLLVSLLIPAIIIITNFLMLTSCLGFFLANAEELSRNMFELMFGPSIYPSGVFSGTMRFFFLFVLPSIAIAGLPIEAVKQLNIGSILIIWFLAGMWSVITPYVLKIGIRHYESGNLTGARI